MATITPTTPFFPNSHFMAIYKVTFSLSLLQFVINGSNTKDFELALKFIFQIVYKQPELFDLLKQSSVYITLLLLVAIVSIVLHSLAYTIFFWILYSLIWYTYKCMKWILTTIYLWFCPDPAMVLIADIQREQQRVNLYQEQDLWMDEEITVAYYEDGEMVDPIQWDPTDDNPDITIKPKKTRRRIRGNLTIELYLYLFSKSDNGTLQYLTAQSLARSWFDSVSPRTRQAERIQSLSLAMEMMTHPTKYTDRINYYKSVSEHPRI